MACVFAFPNCVYCSDMIESADPVKDDWFLLELNIQKITRELNKLLENAQKTKCVKCNTLQCCCWSATSSSSTVTCSTMSRTPTNSSNFEKLKGRPTAPPAYALPKPEWVTVRVANWIRATTSTPFDEVDYHQHSRNFFQTVDYANGSDIEEPDFNNNEEDFESPYTSSYTASFGSDEFFDSADDSSGTNEEVEQFMGHHGKRENVMVWPRTIWDELTSSEEEDWPVFNGKQPPESVRAFFRNFSEASRTPYKAYTYF